jgi:integrase
MNQSKLSILFVANMAKLNRKGLCPLKCRITYNKKRKEFASGFMVDPKKWNSKLQLQKDSSLLNSNIEVIRSKLQKSYISVQLENDIFTVEDIALKYFNKPEQNKVYLISFYNIYLKKLNSLIGKELKESTYKKFEYIRNDLKKFILAKFQKNDILLEELKLHFLEDFDHYLKIEKGHKQITINKALQRLRRVVRVAFAEGLITSDPFMLHKSKRAKKELTFLSELELEKLETYEFQLPRLELVRDLFIFCCYTGLAYREMKELHKINIIKNFDGELWIKIKREKTGKMISVPLLVKPKKIIKKYSSDKELIFPSYSNQKINAYLKEIAVIIGIELNLTHHVARRTFATTVLLFNDVSIEIVSELLGHSSIQITQDYYGKILQKKVGMEMSKLSIKLDKN